MSFGIFKLKTKLPVNLPDLLEPAARTGPGAVPLGTPIRVALLRGQMRGGSTFSELLFKELRFNGKSALDNGADYRELFFGAGASSAPSTDAAKLVDDSSGSPRAS